MSNLKKITRFVVNYYSKGSFALYAHSDESFEEGRPFFVCDVKSGGCRMMLKCEYFAVFGSIKMTYINFATDIVVDDIYSFVISFEIQNGGLYAYKFKGKNLPSVINIEYFKFEPTEVSQTKETAFLKDVKGLFVEDLKDFIENEKNMSSLQTKSEFALTVLSKEEMKDALMPHIKQRICKILKDNFSDLQKRKDDCQSLISFGNSLETSDK